MSFLEGFFKQISGSAEDKSKRRALILYALIGALLFVLYFFFLLKPSVARLFEQAPKIRALKSDIKSVTEDMNFEDKLQAKQQEIVSKIGDYEKKLSREKEIPGLLENLSNMAKGSRVKILSITPLSKDIVKEAATSGGKEKIYQEVPIAITAQAGYHDLGDFIAKLETDERFLNVIDLDMRANKATPKRHDIDIVVFAYTFKGSE